MCGLAGIFQLDGRPAAPSIVRGMAQMLAHRGPDDAGLFCEGPIALGHRRLSIIDLSDVAAQPMRSADGRYVIIFNGEIYNYRELRRELEALGARFTSRSDTEVLLAAYERWGRGALDRLNGMFAFAVWDCKERRLFLARDRFGIKPLYFTWVGNAFCFGSEIKAFMAHPNFSVRVSEEGLVEYFTFQNFFTDRTLFEGVRILPAGHLLEIRLAQRSEAKPEQYWDYNFEDDGGITDVREATEELDRLFVRAVKRQLVSDVEVGSFLSGGIDSGSITAIAARDRAENPEQPNLKTFTVGFDLSSASGLELGFDERAMAEHMSYLFGTEHYEMVLKAGDMQRSMRHLAWHLEEPRVGQSYPNYYAAKLASRFCKVVLAGSGGDELFGGYPWRYYRAMTSDNFEHYTEQYYNYWQRLLPDEALPAIFAPIKPALGRVDTRAIFSSVFKHHKNEISRPRDYVNHSLYFEAKTFLHGVLAVDDKLSMAHGLETRVPFLDNDLVDFAMRVPPEMKLGQIDAPRTFDENLPGHKKNRYFENARDGKMILREAMRKHVPDRVISHPKQGFSAPDATWFKGESIDYVKRRLLGPNAAIFNYLDRKTVHALIEDHLEGRENRRLLIWSLLNVEEWLDTFRDGGWKSLSKTSSVAETKPLASPP